MTITDSSSIANSRVTVLDGIYRVCSRKKTSVHYGYASSSLYHR